MKTKVLIIGSCGFIGSHLSAYLESKNYDVLKVDIVDIALLNYKKVDKDCPDYNSIFKSFSPEYCINCSGAANVPFSFNAPLNDFNLNVHNVVKILDAIRLYCSSCKFINMSSAAIYGNPKSIPINEEIQSNPISPYGFHKIIVESVLEEYFRFFNIKTCTLRIFSAYGNGLKKQIMFDLYNKFVSDSEINLFGTGEETRDYIHIDDICNAIKLVMLYSSFKNDIVNIANGIEVKLNDVVSFYKEYMNSDKIIKYSGNVRTGDPSRWQADISKLKGWGYKQTVDLDKGIKEYIEWVKKESV